MQNYLNKIYAAVIALTAVIVLALVARTWLLAKNTAIVTEVETETRVDSLVLDSIRSIGQWELMAVRQTVVVDTTRSKWLGLDKDHLKRQYKGILSIGIDTRGLSKEWFCKDGQSCSVMLPEPQLLDESFLDETLTETLESDDEAFEEDPEVKHSMAQKAKAMMKEHALTRENIEKARKQARQELSERFRAMGFDTVEVTFGK